MMNDLYYVLLVREDGRWGVQFGDFSRSAVHFERDEYRDKDVRRRDLAILTFQTIGGKAPLQADIDKAVARFAA